MRFEMKMPDLATTDSEIRIVRWLFQPGQKVQRGQPLLEVETDKATMEVESVVTGVVQEVRSAVDATVSVGDVIAVLETEQTSPPAAQASSPQVSPAASPGAAGATAGRGGMFARNRAAAAAPPAPAFAPTAALSLSVAQRVAARRVQESKQTIPHYYLQTSFNASAMVARRKAAEPARLAWDAFFVRAVAKAVAKFDRFRCRFDNEQLVPVQTDAIGVAVDQDDELYVIPVTSPATKTVRQISDDIRQFTARLRAGDPEAKQIHSALLTVTNLGVCNVESFIPIINPPEAAILGIGRVLPTPVVRDDGSVGVEHRCTLTLSVDHRIASGRYAGEFLGAIVRELEELPESAAH